MSFVVFVILQVCGAGRGLHHRSALVDVSRELRWDLRLGHVPSGTITLVGKHLQGREPAGDHAAEAQELVVLVHDHRAVGRR
jgi:hypothetical protein